jgi:D-amino-acid oxidase
MADVVVVGGGIIGLTCAARLLEAGARVRVLTADPPAATTSAVAAAVWYPSHTDADPRVLEWARRSYAVLSDHARQGVPGAALLPTRMRVRRAGAGVPWWASAVGDFVVVGDEWRFTVPRAEMVPYLTWLTDRLVEAGASVVARRVDSLAAAAGDAGVVVNATGLAARTLAADPAVHPARGQVVVVANPGIDTSFRDEDHPDGIVYVHPRDRDVVLGGTYEPGERDVTPRPEVAEAILRRCRAEVPELAGAPVLRHLAGLRPVRDGGPRVALDPATLPGGARLVHAYGHGGAGMTLSWGTADEVVSLALNP